MAISDKITSIQNHLKDDWDSVESLIGDTELDKNIENISSALDDLYNDLPKVTGSGTSITLDDTRKGKLESTLNGNTSQTTYSGKNLLPNNVTSGTRNGITWVVNNDGTILINGTATAQVNISTSSYYFPIDGAYIVSGCPSGGNSNTYSLVVGYYDENKAWKAEAYDTGSGKVLNQNYAYANVGILIRSGTTCNNLLFKPMLEAGSQVTSYEPYVGGTTSPNPSYPQPINVVSGDNEINVVGKNLLVPDTTTTRTSNGITSVINEDGSLTLTGTATANAYLKFTSDMTLESNTTYTTLNQNSILPNNVTMYYNSFGNIGSTYADTVISPGGRLKTYTTGEVNGTVSIAILVQTGVTINTTLYPMLLKGTYTTSNIPTYEPYQGNTYNIDLPVENLLDLTSLNPNQVGQQVSNIQENSFIMSGTAVWGNEYFIYENTNKNTTYTASCKYLSSLARKSGLSIYGTNETTGENLTTINSLLVDIPANVETPVTNTFNSGNYDYIVFRYWNNATATALSSRVDLYVKEVQLEKGSKANSYTPYGTTPIELCKIGNYQDYFGKSDGRNLFDKDNAITSHYYPNSNGGFNTDINATTLVVPIVSGETYTISSTNRSIVDNYSSITFTSDLVTSTTTPYLSRIAWSNNTSSVTFTTPNNAKYIYVYIKWSMDSTAIANTMATIQLEKSSSASDYQPYGVGKWYLHKEIGKVVLNGSEDWSADAGTQGTNYRHNILRSRINVPNPIGIDQTYMSNYFIGHTINNDSGVLGEFYCNANWFIFLDKNKVYLIEQWKDWLSTHPTSIYYVLATPTTEELTYEPLITQLNLLEKAMSKDGQTNISQVNNDLPFIISASALKEWSE